MPDLTEFDPGLRSESGNGPEKTLFGKYQLQAEIGRGGMGVVYRVLHTGLNRVVALKIIKQADFASETLLKMFQREIEALAALQHPNIISIHDIGVEGGQRYYTMDFIDGCTLEDLLYSRAETSRDGTEAASIKALVTYAQNHSVAGTPVGSGDARRVSRNRALNTSQALHLILKLIRAVEHAHNRGVIHRDIKPSNVMMNKEGEPVLMDFGLARQTDADKSMHLTQTGQVMGTPAYMSPEQAKGEKGKINERSDIYSLGALFYEMLTGWPPFIPTGRLVDDIHQIIDKEPVLLRKRNPTVPREQEIICLKAMEKDPERRYRTAGAFAEDVQRYINGDPIQARPQSYVYRARKKMAKHKTVSVSIGVVLLILLGSLGFWYHSRSAAWAQERALAQEKAKSEGKWILAYQNNFDSGVLDSANWFYRLPHLNSLKYGIENGWLVLRSRGTLYSTIKIPGNIKLVFDAIVEDHNELHLKLKCGETYGDREQFYDVFWAEAACVWQKSGLFHQGGLASSLEHQKNVTVEDLLHRNGKVMHVELLNQDGVSRITVDGKIFLEDRDEFPIYSAANSRWGFRSIVGTLRIDNLKVYRQVLAQRVDVLRMVDAFVEQGQVSLALNQLQEILETYEDSVLFDRALKKSIALAQTRSVTPVYLSILARRTLVDRLISETDGGTRDLFMEKAVMSGENIPPEDFEYAVSRYTERLDDGKKFELFCYLGLVELNRGRRVSSSGYFNRALQLRPDSAVERYVKEGRFAPVQQKRQGCQKEIAGGWLPYAFGKCRGIRSFLIDSTEVTQELYARVTGKNPSGFEGVKFGNEPFRPVEQVSWLDAILFCNKRSLLEGLDTCYAIKNIGDTVMKRITTRQPSPAGDTVVPSYGYEEIRGRRAVVTWDSTKKGYRLPTSLEFEYALRCGATTEYFWGREPDSAGNFGWCSGNANGMSHKVAQKRPNGFGLFDMTGNVIEWCWDLYENEKQSRVLRGGSWNDPQDYPRCSAHYKDDPWNRGNSVGFRCVRNAD